MWMCRSRLNLGSICAGPLSVYCHHLLLIRERTDRVQLSSRVLYSAGLPFLTIIAFVASILYTIARQYSGGLPPEWLRGAQSPFRTWKEVGRDYNRPVRTISVSELKANLNHYLQEARRGGEVQILDGGTPVARLVPPAPERHVGIPRAVDCRKGVEARQRICHGCPRRTSIEVAG